MKRRLRAELSSEIDGSSARRPVSPPSRAAAANASRRSGTKQSCSWRNWAPASAFASARLDAVRVRCLGAADEQVRRGLDRAARQVAPGGDRVGEPDQPGPVDVEDALGVRLVARRRMVAGHEAEVLDAVQRRRRRCRPAARAGCGRGPVSCMTGSTPWWCSASATASERRVRVRARVVGDVDRVGPLAERLELAFHLGDAAAVDRRHLGRDGRAAGEQGVLEARHHAATGASRCASSSLAFLTALDASAE